MDSNYLDFGTPISFGWTAQYLDAKTQTRRQWKDSHAAKILRAYDRAATSGQLLRVPAIDKAYHAGGRQIGWCVIRSQPCKQRLRDMPEADLLAEGRMCATVADFIAQYFEGNADLEVWVIDFEFLPSMRASIDAEESLDTKQVSNPSAKVKVIRNKESVLDSGVDVDFVDRQISRIASDGDSARWRLASHLRMFEVLSIDGTLTDTQRQAVDNFAIGWQIAGCKCEDCDDANDVPAAPIKSCCIPHQPKPRTRFFDFDPEYDDPKYDRELTVKRYLQLIESPVYRVDLSIEGFTESGHSPPEREQRGLKPKPSVEKDLSLPSNLDISARKISWGLRKKILAALAIWSLPRGETVNVRTLFAEVKFRGFEYNYKSQIWEYQYRARSTN